jgi:hypothetical protein
MKWTMPAALLLCLAPLPSFAGSWSGVLVDSKCYENLRTNTNPFEPYPDENLDLWYCRPNLHTKSFAVVREDWARFKLDAAGNAKAAELVRNADKKSHYLDVAVTGELDKGTVQVASISLVK